MKKFFPIIGMLMLISSVVLAGGIENPLLPSNMAIMKTTLGARIIYTTEKSSNVQVTIFKDGKEVYSEQVKSKASFSRLYNLSNLPEGEYRVIMEDENGRREELFSNYKKIEVLSSVIHAKKLKKCLVTLYSKEDAYVKIELKDDNKNVLSSGRHWINGQSAQLYNLQDVKGPVHVEVTDQNGVVRSTTIE